MKNNKDDKKLNNNVDEPNETIKDTKLSQKGFVENIGEAFSGLFSKESPKHFQKILEDPSSPAYQKNLALQGIVLKKIKTLNLTLIQLIKGNYGASPDIRTASANALSKIGGFYSLDIPSVLLIDLMEIYMSTADLKLYDSLHRLFLSEDLFPYYKFAVKTLVSRFGIADEVNALVWEVFSRILNLCFDFKYREMEHSLKSELRAIKQSPDKQKYKLEQSVHYMKSLITLADEVRETLCESLSKEKDMIQTIEVMRYPSLTASYHEKCKFNKLLEPIMSALIDDKADIRSYVMQELYEIKTPCAYDFYRSVILNNIQPYPDVSQNLLQLMGTLSINDGACLDIFISFITTPPNTTGELFFNELEKICIQNEDILSKVVSTSKSAITRGDCPEFSINQLVSKIFPIEISKDTLDFIVNMALGRMKISLSSGARAARILTKFNDASFEYANEVFKTIEFIMTHSGPHEIKESVFRGIRKNPTGQNISCLAKAVFDIDKDSALTAVKTYLELAKAGNIEDDKLVSFYMELCSSETITPDSVVLVIDFLKGAEYTSPSIKKAFSKFLYNKYTEIRKNAFELCALWFATYETEEELATYLSLFSGIMSDPQYTFIDTYKKIVNLIAEFLSSREENVSNYAENIFSGIRTMLDSSISPEHKIILCGLLEYTAENAQQKIRMQAEWHMETAIKAPGLPNDIVLYLLKSMVLKQKKLIPFTRPIVKLLSESQSNAFKVGVLEIFMTGFSDLPKYSDEEKISAYTQKSPKEIYDYVQWEIGINKELLPLIHKTMLKEFSDLRLISVSISVMKFLIHARSCVGFLFEFKDYPADEAIQIRAIESVSALIHPELTVFEQNILRQLSIIAEGKNLPNAIRQNAIKALGKICDMNQLEVLTEILSDQSEREDIRISCARAINQFKTPFANAIYAEILSNQNLPESVVEAILIGMEDFADSRILDVVISLMQGTSTKLTKLCTELLTNSGYEETVKIQNLYKESEKLEASIENLRIQSETAVQKLEQFPSQLSVLQNDRDALTTKYNLTEENINSEREVISKLTHSFEVSQEYINSKIKEFIPNWPIEKRPPLDKKELFMDYQEQLREEKDSYNLAVEESDKKIDLYTKEQNRTEEFLNEMNAHIDYLNKSKDEYEEAIAKYRTETPKLKKRIEQLLKEAKIVEQEFSKAIPSIDEENHKRLLSALEKREEEWEKRTYYYSIIEKNV